ncbi:MAG: hypothetical protein IJ175_04720 [Clostridia bacterium]|nr:hypothetical protein [Clostridia bacterium]
MNEKADSILQFLEVDKRAELVSENAFVQSTIANYDTIMANPEHRIATLTNLQQTKKIAAQHIDFYLFRLKENNEKASGEQSESQARKRYREFERESAYCDAALRLYYICSILEIHLSGNYSTSFIHYIADDIEKRTTDVHDTLTGYCAVLKAAIKHIKPDGIALPGARVAIAPFKKILDDFTARENDLKSSSFEKSILAIETEQSRQVECIVTPDGQAYIKKC